MAKLRTLQQLYASRQDLLEGDSLEDVAGILLDILNMLNFDFDNVSQCECGELVIQGVSPCKYCDVTPNVEKLNG